MFWHCSYGMLAFDFKCPEEMNRNIRVKLLCTDKTPEHYSCLFDQRSNIYKESCTDPADFVRPGKCFFLLSLTTCHKQTKKQKYMFMYTVYSLFVIKIQLNTVYQSDSNLNTYVIIRLKGLMVVRQF